MLLVVIIFVLVFHRCGSTAQGVEMLIRYVKSRMTEVFFLTGFSEGRSLAERK